MEKNTKILISGADKAVIGDFAATVRRQREPEPYKGKGIRWDKATIQMAMNGLLSSRWQHSVRLQQAMPCRAGFIMRGKPPIGPATGA